MDTECASDQLTFQPIRGGLYSSAELMSGYDPTNPLSMKDIPDFKSYVYFVINGRATPAQPYAGMMEALHDNSILQAMFRFLRESKKPTAAIMGGHKEVRGSPNYRAVVEISKKLTEKGFIMASGGGPGAMEATHLGALLAGHDQSEVDSAVSHLANEPILPDSSKIVSDKGVIDDGLVAAIHKWAKPAFEVFRDTTNPGVSLAVPTWHYGHEPLTPLATHVAKYFQNSIREDVLLGLASNGIIYAPGKAGTLQEIFQDAAQNYYHGDDAEFSPMIFFSKYWSADLPVEPLLKPLFHLNGRGAEYDAKVRFMDKVDEVVEFLLSQSASPDKTMDKFHALGMGPSLQRVIRQEKTLVGTHKG